MGKPQSRRTAVSKESDKTASSKNSSSDNSLKGWLSRWHKVEPWFGLLVRLILGGIQFWAGFSKIGDLQASVLAVRAYQLLPQGLADFVGYALPIGEIILGLVLIFGFFTRYAAIANALLMIAFIFGIGWAWAKGLNIDCGCFGGGGVVEPSSDQGLTYFTDIVRDIFITAGAVYLVIRPRTKFALDGLLDFK